MAWFLSLSHPVHLRSQAVNPSKMEALFSKYKDEGDDTVSIQGVLAMAEDLSLEMTDLRVTILLAFINFVKLTSTKTDFLKGLSELRCDSVDALGSKLTQLQSRMPSDDALFKRVFEYAYVGNLEVSCAMPSSAACQVLLSFSSMCSLRLQPGQKALKRDIACAILPVVLSQRWALTDQFVSFLNSTTQDRVSKDTWKTLIPFMRVLPNKSALASYEDDGSWPVVMDDFVEYMQAGGGAAGAGGSA